MRSQLPQREDFAHFHRLETRWSDLDLLGHVNNARYFSFDESARLDYFAPLASAPDFWKKEGFILARIGCDFLQQLHHPAVVEVGFRITRIGRSSMDTEGAMFVGDKLIAVTRGVLVWFDYASNRAAPVPPHARSFIRGKEKLAPEETA